MISAERIKTTIDTQGRKYTWVARELGISDNYLSRLLSGDRRWTDELVRRVAHLLGVPEALFFVEDAACMQRIDDQPQTETQYG